MKWNSIAVDTWNQVKLTVIVGQFSETDFIYLAVVRGRARGRGRSVGNIG